MGYLAAKTETIEIGSAILNIYSRTPGALLQTAAGLDNVSGGRAILGLGASGPQVIEGFHGVPYSKPLGRTAEVIDIVRRGLKREPLDNDGIFKLPLSKEDGAVTGLGKPLKILTRPERDTIPIYIAALGPKSVEQAAEIADGWIPHLFHPEKAHLVWGDALEAGTAKRSADLAPARDQRRRHGRHRRGPGDEGAAGLRAPDLRALRRRHGRPGQELLQRRRLLLRLREGGRGDPGPLPRRARRRRRRRSSRPSGWRRPTSSAPRPTSRSGSPPSARPASPTSRSHRRPTTRPPPSRRSRNGSPDPRGPATAAGPSPPLRQPRRIRPSTPTGRRRDPRPDRAPRVPVGLLARDRDRLHARLRRAVDRPAAAPDRRVRATTASSATTTRSSSARRPPSTGIDSERGHAAVRRLNRIHGHYDIPNDELAYVLATTIVGPVRWISRYGWRPLDPHELVAITRVTTRFGELMGIKDLPDDVRRLPGSCSSDYEREHFAPTPAGHAVAEATIAIGSSVVPCAAPPAGPAGLDRDDGRAAADRARDARAARLARPRWSDGGLRARGFGCCASRRRGATPYRHRATTYPGGHRLSDLGPLSMLDALNAPAHSGPTLPRSTHA